MNSIRQRCEVKKGKMAIDSQVFKDLISTLEDGRYIITVEQEKNPKTIEEFRRHYFFLRDELHLHGGTGYTLDELHELIKAHVFPNIPAEPKYFNLTNVDITDIETSLSTKWLTEEGWKLFIKHVKGFAWENFQCYL